MDHSVRGYLERRTTNELKGILDFFERRQIDGYEAEFAMIQEILAQREKQEE